MSCYPCSHCNQCGKFNLKVELRCVRCDTLLKANDARCSRCGVLARSNVRTVFIDSAASSKEQTSAKIPGARRF
jgi:hypothetical protein